MPVPVIVASETDKLNPVAIDDTAESTPERMLERGTPTDDTENPRVALSVGIGRGMMTGPVEEEPEVTADTD